MTFHIRNTRASPRLWDKISISLGDISTHCGLSKAPVEAARASLGPRPGVPSHAAQERLAGLERRSTEHPALAGARALAQWNSVRRLRRNGAARLCRGRGKGLRPARQE